MDPDAEFNLLTNLYQSVVNDMKHTYPGWEQVSQKAMKLGAQLKATAQCLSAFVEAMQGVCDHANSLKGASRDVAACVTRVCIKQKSLESRMRSWADALCDELAVSLQQRCAYWKSRITDLDKVAAKHVKKVRSRKQRPDTLAMSEQREICGRVLTEQRTQFSFFINTLMPVLTAEMSVLDEGSHLRPIVENLDSTIKHVDTEQLVASIVSDIAQGPDCAWKQCLAQAGQKWRSSEDGYSVMGSVRDLSTRATTPASTFSSEDGVGGPQTSHGLVSSRSISTSCAKNLPLVSSQGVSSTSHYSHASKPPLQRRNSEKSIGQSSLHSPLDSSLLYLNLVSNPSSDVHSQNGSMTTSNTNTSTINGQNHAPVPRNVPTTSSSSSHYEPALPSYQQVVSHKKAEQYQRQTVLQRPQCFSCELPRYNPSNNSSCIGVTPIYQPQTPQTFSGGGDPSNSCSSSDGATTSSAQLIAEACRDIDQLGSDLESYCTTNDGRLFIHHNPYNMSSTNGGTMLSRRTSHASDIGKNIDMNSSTTTKRASMSTIPSNASSATLTSQQPTSTHAGVRMRTTSGSRPPPPARRSSQITAATPTAPSVAEQRMNGGSIMGSRVSLDSVGTYDNHQQYQQQLANHHHFNSYQQPTNGYEERVSTFGHLSSSVDAAAKYRL